MALTIRSRSWSRKYGEALSQALPGSLRTLLQGKRATARLDLEAWPTIAKRGPIDVIVPTDLLLRTRLSIPRSSRNDLPYAVNLFLGEKTPFAPTEVLVDAEEQDATAGDEQSEYIIRILPRVLLDRAMTRWGTRLGRIGKISVLEPSGEITATDFESALFPNRRYSRWGAAIPIAILLGGIGLYAAADLNARQTQVTALETEVQSATATAKALANDLQAREKASSGNDAVLAAVGSVPSAFATLEAIRHVLPEQTHVTGVELQGAKARLAIRSANVLGDMQKIATANSTWQAAIEGAITASPQGDGEIGTIVLQSVSEAPK